MRQSAIPIIAHNSAKFDAHLVVSSLEQEDRNIESVEHVIATTSQTFISFQLKFRFELRRKMNVWPTSARENGAQTKPDSCYCHRIRKCAFKVRLE